MNTKKIPLLSVLFLTACVTINIYFPAAAAEKAADEIIQDIQSSEPEPAQNEVDPQSHLSTWQLSFYKLADQAISMLITSAHAEANLAVNSAGIRRIQASMHNRFPDLKVFYEQGFIGIKSDGLLASKGNIPLKDRNKINKLIKAENNDRNKLYQEIATANHHPEWSEQIKSTFAKRWISNAQSGWWYQTSKGRWKQK